MYVYYFKYSNKPDHRPVYFHFVLGYINSVGCTCRLAECNIECSLDVSTSLGHTAALAAL